MKLVTNLHKTSANKVQTILQTYLGGTAGECKCEVICRHNVGIFAVNNVFVVTALGDARCSATQGRDGL